MSLQAVTNQNTETQPVQTIQSITDRIGSFGKDIKLNLQSVVTAEGSLGLTPEQRAGIALASAYAVGHEGLIDALKSEFNPSAELIEAAKASATIMAMNNVYYRFIHLADDKELTGLPAKLRMNVMAKPSVPRVDFELMSLAVSAISGCGMCINAHINEVKKVSVSLEAIQSAVRIASVINATKTALNLS